MTLNHAAHTLTAVLTVAGSVGFVMTGSLTLGLLLLAAPWPALWVQKSERQTWSLGEVLRGERDREHPVAGALDDALRGPLPVRPDRDEDYFVPGVPRLGAGPSNPEWDDVRLSAPTLAPPPPDARPIARRQRSAPVSTPLR